LPSLSLSLTTAGVGVVAADFDKPALESIDIKYCAWVGVVDATDAEPGVVGVLPSSTVSRLGAPLAPRSLALGFIAADCCSSLPENGMSSLLKFSLVAVTGDDRSTTTLGVICMGSFLF